MNKRQTSSRVYKKAIIVLAVSLFSWYVRITCCVYHFTTSNVLETKVRTDTHQLRKRVI